MADLKISQLTQATTLQTTDVMPVVNTGITRNATINTINNTLPITTFVRSNSANWASNTLSFAQFAYTSPFVGGPLYGGDNLINNTDNYLPWRTQILNTNASVYELVNPNSSNARIAIKQTGYYNVVTNIGYFDCYNNTMSIFLDLNLFSAGGTWARLATLNRTWFPTVTPNPDAVLFVGNTIIQVPTAPRFISVAVRPTANTPFPSSISGTPPTILINRIGNI